MSRFSFRRGFAKGRTTRRVPGAMNGLERAYAAQLEVRKAIAKVADFKFDALKLRLADTTFYTPDFFVLMPDGTMEFHEVKGSHWEDDARVKIKVAAEQYPYFTFKAITRARVKDGGGWSEEVF